MPAIYDLHSGKNAAYFTTLFIFCIFLFSCKNNRNRDTYLHAYENKLGIKPSKLAQIDTIHFTSVEWTDPIQHFGSVTEGDSVILTFRCRNTGENPLFLSDIYSPCGCTVPYYTEKPVLPGEEDLLRVYFNTAGQQDSVFKKIIVTSNTSNKAKHVLYFDGLVVARTKPVKK